MRKYSLLLLLFFISSSFGLVNNCNISYNSYGAVEFVGLISSFELEVRTFPQSCESAPYSIVDTENGKILQISGTDPGSEYLWNFDCNFENVAEYKQLDTLLEYPHEFDMNYTEFTEYADCNEDISRKASEITRGSRSTLEAGLKLARWVHENIEYDILYGETIKKSTWVFENLKGVCDEYANLFVSMARSLGIPTRFVSGVAYTNLQNNFGPHAWAEFYVGKWVLVDLTFGQYGTIDASHVDTYHSEDAGFNAETIVAYGSGSTSFPSEPENSATAECSEKNIFSVEASFDRSEISDEDYALLTIEVENPFNYYIPLSVKFTRVEKIELLHGNYEDFIILAPLSKSVKNYLLHVEDLPNNYIYTMPIGISVDFAEKKNLTLHVDPRLSSNTHEYYLSKISDGLIFNPQMEMNSFEISNPNYDNNATLLFSLKNKGNEILDLGAEIIYEGISREIDLSQLLLNQEKDFQVNFPINEFGEFDALLEISSGNISLSRSFQLISAETPNMYVNYGGSFWFDESLEFNVSTTVCDTGTFTVKTPTKDFNLWLGDHSLEFKSSYFKPGNNTLTFSIICIDQYGTTFDHEKEVKIEYKTYGLNSLWAWIKYLWNLLVGLFS